MVKTKLKSAGQTDPGRVRRNNEDAFHLDAERGIFLVVDGIGGQAAGEKASALAVERIRARLERQTGTIEQRIREAITVANNEILQAARTNPEWNGMACVLTVAVLENGSAVIGHVGDSRLYVIADGDIRKVTHDHSPVGEREDTKELTEAEAMRHPRRNEVFRDVGSETHEPDDPNFIESLRIPFNANSALVLCSDGLSDQVASDEIRRAVERHAGDPAAAVRDLIDAANRAGGKDNVTVLVVEGEQFTAPPQVDAPPAVAESSSLFASRPALFFYGLILALAAAWFSRAYWVAPPVTIQARTLVVGNGAPFTTIAQAMEAARSGDSIEVSSGDYHEQIHLKSGVSVRSRVPRESRLLPSPVGAGAAVIAEDVQHARISGFLIQGEELAPLAMGILVDNSGVEIDNVEISGAGVGIEIRGQRAPDLTGNAIHDSLREGVLIEGPSAPWISHNTFQRNKGPALAARGGAKPSLVGNVFDKNTLELPPDMMDAVREHNFILEARPPASTVRGGKKK